MLTVMLLCPDPHSGTKLRIVSAPTNEYENFESGRLAPRKDERMGNITNTEGPHHCNYLRAVACQGTERQTEKGVMFAAHVHYVRGLPV
jgi:hypothetical protein